MTKIEMNQPSATEDFARLLAACYYQPEAHLGEEDVFSALAGAGEQLDPVLAILAGQLDDAYTTHSLDVLLLDYSRLFLGPFDIPAKPYGSVWLEDAKTVMGKSTLAVRELYRQGGFELDENFREMPDHVAVELEFLYLLNFQIRAARQNGAVANLDKLVNLKRDFLQQHLGRWAEPFTAAMKTAAETSFYQLLADLTVNYIRLELAQGDE